MNARTWWIAPLAIAAAACAALPPQPDEVTLTPDRPDSPRSVRFDVPTALIMGISGERIPITAQARISTRHLAAHELASAGYCPRGFTGPDEVFFPHGNRSRAAFVVRCAG